MAQENDMQRLQQEAVRRVREMQSRAQMAAPPHGADGALSPQPDLLRLLFQEEDRTLILLLLLVLLEENQDPSLLLALLYLAMSPG